MLETYFPASKIRELLRSGPSGPYLDGFAAALERQGYSADTAVRYLRAAAHLGHVLASRGVLPGEIDLQAFSKHLRARRCPRAKGGRHNHHTIYGAKLFRRYLVEIGVCRPAAAAEPAELQLVTGFKAWLRKHRGASDATIRLYARDAAGLLTALGEDPANWDAAGIRRTFMDRASTSGRGTIEKMTTGLRAFLRYLAVEGRCRVGLDSAVPAYAHWQLADMPRSLSPEHVQRLIAACDGDVPARRRERAIILLLVRLGLRAGDVAQLRLADIEWETGSLRVSGKSRYQVRLPLPQDVGDAIVAYLEVPTFELTERSCVFAHDRAMPAVKKRRRRLVAREARHEAGRHRHAIQRRARAAPHGGDRDAAPWRTVGEDRLGPAASRHRHDRLLRKGRCRAPEADRAALAGGVLMLNAIETYLGLRRAAGFAMSNDEYLLKSFAAFAAEHGQSHVHTQTAIDWAALGPSVAERDARLKAVCRFVRHVRIEDDRHELPPANHFGARKRRRPPHIYSAAELDRLIEAALQLRPDGGLRAETYATLIALLAATGLRISEALKLTVADVTRDGLLIRKTKFRKTRLVPLHDTAATGLQRYLSRRRPCSDDDPVFIGKSGGAMRYIAVKETFDRLASKAGIAPVAQRRPRLHDLRHTFAVRALADSPSGRSRSSAHMVALSTYMGHVNIYATYWYLEATADLMRDVAAAGEQFLGDGRRS